MDQTVFMREAGCAFSRRQFLRVGTTGLAGLAAPSFRAQRDDSARLSAESSMKLEYLTREENFKNVGRGKPPPDELSAEARRSVGLAPETWQLEVGPDPDSDSKLDRPLMKAAGTALNWSGLLKLAETKAVRFLQVISCTNMSGPLGMGLWEGVPLREVIWMARPTANVRRVFYHGYFNDDPLLKSGHNAIQRVSLMVEE